METKNIYSKIQQSRVDVLGSIRKGTEGYTYNYFSNDDILPIANEVLNRNGLCPLFHIEDRPFEKTSSTKVEAGIEVDNFEHEHTYWGVLKVVNVENPQEYVVYEIPTCIASLKSATAIQNYGAMQTFAKRYLYISFLEIADMDNNDEGGVTDKDVEKSNDSGKKSSKATDKQIELIKSKASNDDLKGILEFYKVSSVEELDVKQASDCLKRLG